MAERCEKNRGRENGQKEFLSKCRAEKQDSSMRMGIKGWYNAAKEKYNCKRTIKKLIGNSTP